jgi:hypothetical protein
MIRCSSAVPLPPPPLLRAQAAAATTHGQVPDWEPNRFPFPKQNRVHMAHAYHLLLTPGAPLTMSKFGSP